MYLNVKSELIYEEYVQIDLNVLGINLMANLEDFSFLNFLLKISKVLEDNRRLFKNSREMTEIVECLKNFKNCRRNNPTVRGLRYIKINHIETN